MGQSITNLPLEQRLLRYRQMSKNALKRAAREEDRDLKARFLSMATGWHILAEEIEKANERIATVEEHYHTRQASGRRDH